MVIVYQDPYKSPRLPDYAGRVGDARSRDLLEEKSWKMFRFLLLRKGPKAKESLDILDLSYQFFIIPPDLVEHFRYINYRN